MTVVVLVLLAVLGAALQRSVGVGYSLLVLPGALLALADDRAVPCVLAVGVLLTGGLLLRYGLPAGLGRARPLLIGAPFGQLLAAVALGDLDGAALRVLTAIVLVAGCSLAAARPVPRELPPAALSLAGIVVGAIGSLTGVIGPFLAVLLVALGERAEPGELRRRLWLSVATLSVTSLAIAAATGAGDVSGALTGIALAPALLAGALLGAPLARRLPPRHVPRTVLGVAALGAVVLIAGA